MTKEQIIAKWEAWHASLLAEYQNLEPGLAANTYTLTRSRMKDILDIIHDLKNMESPLKRRLIDKWAARRSQLTDSYLGDNTIIHSILALQVKEVDEILKDLTGNTPIEEKQYPTIKELLRYAFDAGTEWVDSKDKFFEEWLAKAQIDKRCLGYSISPSNGTSLVKIEIDE